MILWKWLIIGKYWIISIAIIFFLIIKIPHIEGQVQYGQLMMGACNDIQAHEKLLIIDDFNKIIQEISTHTHSNIDTIYYANIIEQLKLLEDEALTEDCDIGSIDSGFSQVLEKLCCLELLNSISLIELNDYKNAKISVHMAYHYLEDATKFSGKDHFEKESWLIQSINDLAYRNEEDTKIKIYEKEILSIIKI